MYAILKKLVLVVGKKQIEYDIEKGVIGNMEIVELSFLSPKYSIVFDITKCHPEYVLDILLDKKGDINAIVRSLYRNQSTIWTNQSSVYSDVASYLADHKGMCVGIPCYSCPFGYLVQGEHCTDSGYRGSALPIEPSMVTMASAKEYLGE